MICGILATFSGLISLAFGFTERPLNLAAKIGESVNFHCGTVYLNDTIVWREHITHASEGSLIGEKDNIYHSSRAARYSISKLDSGVYSFTISHLTSEDAGVYSCYSTHLGLSSSAYLVILDDDPVCSGTHRAAVDGDYVIYSCKLHFTGIHVPTMEWTSETEQDIPNLSTSSNTVTATKMQANAIIQAMYRYNGRRYRCKTFFEDHSKNTDYPSDFRATNSPTYVSIYITMPLIVHSPPRDISISPEKFHYYSGDMIECMATSSPTAKYKWVEMRTGKVQDTNVLAVTKDMLGRKYKCIAYNLIGDAEYRKELVIQLRTYEAPAYIWILGFIIRLGALILILIVAPYRSVITRLVYGPGQTTPETPAPAAVTCESLPSAKLSNGTGNGSGKRSSNKQD